MALLCAREPFAERAARLVALNPRVVDSIRRAVPDRRLFTFLGASCESGGPGSLAGRVPSCTRPSPQGSTPLQFDNRPNINGRPEGGGRRRRSRRNRQRFNEGGAPPQPHDVFTQPEFPQPVGPPLLSPDQLAEMSKAELNELAKTFEIENPTKVKKDDLVAQIVEIQAQRSGLEKANGVLDVLPEGYGFLRREGYLVGSDDIYISQSQIRRFELRRGDLVAGQVRRPKENEKYYGIVKVETVNGRPPEEIAGRRVFDEVGAEPPAQRFVLETRGDLATRALDLFAPLGRRSARAARRPAAHERDGAGRADRARDRSERSERARDRAADRRAPRSGDARAAHARCRSRRDDVRRSRRKPRDDRRARLRAREAASPSSAATPSSSSPR